jgi:catechol 2,3-dioxygenase-like lactoylglutathione lyase family enzyme
MADQPTYPHLVQIVLDTTNARQLAEFYRELLGFVYRPGDEQTDPDGDDWLVLRDADDTNRLAFQQVPALPEATWPEGPRPQQLHLDLSVTSMTELDRQHERALSLGARLLMDRSEDPVEQLRVYADPARHPFCIVVVPPK